MELGTSDDLNGNKLNLDDQGNHFVSYTYNQFGITQVLQRSPIQQTSNWSETFFAVSYSKLAIAEQVGGVNQELEDMKNPRVLTSKVIYTRTRTPIFESFSTNFTWVHYNFVSFSNMFL